MSRRPLERAFRAALGRAPAEEIARAGLRRAAELLAATTQPIDEIARAVGFRSRKRFVAAFRRAYGRGPEEWRLA